LRVDCRLGADFAQHRRNCNKLDHAEQVTTRGGGPLPRVAINLNEWCARQPNAYPAKR
jgi:hypothetical protein